MDMISEVAPQPRRPLAPTVLFGVSGVAAMIWLAASWPTLVFVSRARPVEATYVGSVARAGGDHGGTFLYPQFRFTTADGHDLTFTSRSGSTDQPFGEAQKLRVLYNPSQPWQARRDSLLDLWAAPLFLSLFVAAPLIVGMLLAWRLRRRWTAPKSWAQTRG